MLPCHEVFLVTLFLSLLLEFSAETVLKNTFLPVPVPVLVLIPKRGYSARCSMFECSTCHLILNAQSGDAR